MTDAKVISCPMCSVPVEVPPGQSQVVCGICSSAIVVGADGEPVLESDLKRQERRKQNTPAPTSPAEPTVTSDRVEAVTENASQLPAPPDLDASLPAPPILDTLPSVDSAKSPMDAHAFEGSLQNLSIVDVLQLLYSSRKTGVLQLHGPTGRASIRLLEGHIIGCEHPKKQIGQMLVEMGAIKPGDVDRALKQQQHAGDDRLPLVGTLVAMGRLEEQVGWQALEKLVESTVVHVVNWPEGKFIFEVEHLAASDDFRHLVTGVSSSKVGLDTQTTLLEALKALDENNRDGTSVDVSMDGFDSAFDDAIGASAEAANEPSDDATTAPDLALPEHEPDGIEVTQVDGVESAQPDGVEATRPDGVIEVTHTDIVDVTEVTQPDVDVTASQPVEARPATTPFVERVRRQPLLLAGAAGGLVLLIVILLVVLLASGRKSDTPTTDETTESPTGTTAAATAETDGDAVADSATDMADANPADAANEMPAAVVGNEAEDKPEKGRRKRKGRRRKAKDARSLFDAALKK